MKLQGINGQPTRNDVNMLRILAWCKEAFFVLHSWNNTTQRRRSFITSGLTLPHCNKFNKSQTTPLRIPLHSSTYVSITWESFFTADIYLLGNSLLSRFLMYYWIQLATIVLNQVINKQDRKFPGYMTVRWPRWRCLMLLFDVHSESCLTHSETLLY